MKTLGLTDVIGPIMVGPSSSHTAGALRIAYMARRLCLAEPKTVEFRLLGSFAHTLTGHGTDKALVAGMLGLATDDLRIRDSFDLAREAGLAFSFVTLPDAEYDHPTPSTSASWTPRATRWMCAARASAAARPHPQESTTSTCASTGESASIVVRQRDEKGVLAHIAQSISDEGVNIATTRMYRERKGDTAYTVLETDQAVGAEAKAAIEDHPAIYDVRIIPGDARADVERVAVPDVAAALQRFAELDFGNGAALLAYCEEHGATLSEAFLAREAALAASLGYADGAAAYLREALAVMRCAARRPIDEALPSMGGLIGGEARKLADLHERGGELCDDQLSCAIAYAMAVLETNASMGRIVAAPTAGSAGVLPGVLLALQRTRGYGDDDLAHGLAAAAAIGYLITRNATVSGAEGGCQAEVGSAAAMAAAASVELMGGTPAQCFAAASNALTNMMGLVCDPIAGLVEEPCQKRNAAGAAVALVSAQIALAGIGNLVDFDQTVEAMRKVGRSLPFELRESALGGIAAAPTACAYCPDCA